jgi:alpha-tubulin suppressor-like RCC1 family protein
MRINRLLLTLLLVGTPVAAVVATPSVVLADPFTYSSIDVGNQAVCAVTTDGTGLCWGSNRDQYLISTSREDVVPTPTKISLPNNDRFVSLDGGANRTWCGLATSGKVYCWGDHHIGRYFTTTSRTPVAVEFPHAMTVTVVHSGYSNGCAVNTDGELWCWGDILESGSGETEPMRTPVKVAIPSGERVIDFDNGGASCAVTDLGNIYCWGHSNGAGQLGIGYVNNFAYAVSVTPLKVLTPAGVTFASVTTGLEHSCALSTIGTGYCWGDNYQGLFGDNSYLDSSIPTPMIVPNDEKLALITTGWYHTCVLTISGKTWCMGRGDFGELGTGTTLGGKTYRTPLVPSGTQFTFISAALGTTCGITLDNNAWCWGGLNWGTSGNGNIRASLSPSVIAAVGTPTVSLSAATDIDAEAATIRGTVNANGNATRMTVEYSTSPVFSSSLNISVFTVLRDGNYTPVAIPAALSALAPRSTYYARMTATNTFGTTVSNVISFMTLGTEPTVSDLNVSHITGNEADISVSVNPGRLSTSSILEYSQDHTFVSDVASVSLGSIKGSDTQTLAASLSALHARTTYYTRVVSTNQLGSTTSLVASFTTIGALPQATLTSTESSLSSITAAVSVDTGLLSGYVYLEASTNRNFTDSASSNVSTFVSGGPTQHSLVISGLSNRTDYFIRAIATNELGSFTTDTLSVRTRGGLPTVSIIQVVPYIGSATIETTIETTGLTTFVIAKMSTNADMSEHTEHFISSGTVSGSQSLFVRDLEPRTPYFVQVVATNAAGTTSSDITSFTALSPIGVVINDDRESTTSLSVTLNITAPENTAAVRISNYANFRNARVLKPTESVTWQLLTSANSQTESTVWVQFVSTSGVVSTYFDTIVIAPENSPSAESDSTVVESPVMIASQRSPVRTATVISRGTRANIVRIQTKIGKKISSRVTTKKTGAFTVTFPKGVTRMQVRFVSKSGAASRWTTISSRK